MPDKYIEKSFLYLTLLSVVLHAAVFGLIASLPPQPQPGLQETTFVELEDLPELPPPAKPEPRPRPEPKPLPKALPKPEAMPQRSIAKLPPERALPKARTEAAPEADGETDRIAKGKETPKLPGKEEPNEQAARVPGPRDSALSTPEKGGKEALRGEGLFKPNRAAPEQLAKLFPSARSLGQTEESLRKRYLEAERGDTRLMDTDDPDVGGFSRRFRAALLDRLRAIDPFVRKGAGTTIVQITFKRDGSIEEMKILYSTGNRALDDLALQASRTASYVGPLPKRWSHDALKLIYAFSVVEGYVTTAWH